MMQWVDHFLRHAPRKRPLLLLMDNYGPHVGGKFIAKAAENDLFPVYLPPHTTHLWMPIDTHMGRPYNKAYDGGIARLRAHSISLIPQHFFQISGYAYYRGFSANNAKNAFRDLGIFPLCKKRLCSRISEVFDLNDRPKSRSLAADEEDNLESKELDWDRANAAKCLGSLCTIFGLVSYPQPVEDVSLTTSAGTSSRAETPTRRSKRIAGRLADEAQLESLQGDFQDLKQKQTRMEAEMELFRTELQQWRDAEKAKRDGERSGMRVRGARTRIDIEAEIEGWNKRKRKISNDRNVNGKNWNGKRLKKKEESV